MSDPAALAEPSAVLNPRDEPAALAARLRELVASDPATGRAEAVRSLASWWWRAWRPMLAPQGMTAASFRAVVAGADREIWLWLMGDRPFDVLQSAVAGRAIRRINR